MVGCRPGHCAALKLILENAQEEPGESQIEFTKRPAKIVWKVHNLTWGGKPYGFSFGHVQHPMTVTLTSEVFEFKATDGV